MFKFLRKYDKWILAVGGTLLLITFLAPQAIQGLADYSAQTGASWATVGDSKTTITLGEAERLRRQARLIDSMGPQTLLNQLGAGSDPAHWFLLRREAEQAGMIGGPGEGYALATRMAQASGEDVTPEQVIAILAGRAGLNFEETIQTLSEVQGVARLIATITTAGRFSDARLRGTAARKSLGVAADVVVIDAREDETIEIPAAGDDALQAQFAEHADALQGEGGRGFGYRIPDRFKIEWFTVSKADVEASLADDPALGPIEMRKAFQRNPEKFGGGAISSSSTPASFDSRKDRVREVMLGELVEERMQAIAKFSDDWMQFPRRSLVRSGLHYVLPEDWATRRGSLTGLAAEIGKDFGIEAPAVESVSEEWIVDADLDDAERFGGLSTAGTELFGRRRATVKELVPSLKEFGGSDTIPIQAGVALPTLATPEGDLVVARITEVDPTHAPADLDEVREQVAADLDAVSRYDALVERLPEIEAVARTEGIRAVADGYGVPVEFAADIREANLEFLIQYGIAMTSSIPGLGSDADAISSVVDTAMTIDPTKPLVDQPIEKRIFAVPLPERLAVMIVAIDRVSPLTVEDWERLATNPAPLQSAIGQDLGMLDPMEAFTLEILAERNGFELTRSDEEDEEFDETADDGDEATG